MIRGQRLFDSQGNEVCLFPLEYMYISNGPHNLKAIDFLGWNTQGRVYNCECYAPFSGSVVYTGNDHNMIYWSNSPVRFADGTLDYATILVAHSMTSPPSVGTSITQGDLWYHTGNYGQSTGDHLHMEVAKGHVMWDSSTWTNLDSPYDMWNMMSVNDTTRVNDLGYNWRLYNLQWIARDDYLNQSEMENNATIIINYYRSIGLEDRTIAAILGNMQSESTLSPILNERGGGGGYGLVQWTPKSDLINACNTLGLSPYTSGDVQIQVIIQEIDGPQSVRQWYTTQGFIINYYNSGATSDMVGISGDDFLHNTMNWSPEKLAIMFMAGYERPSYNPLINHYIQRQANARSWFNFMSGVTPPTPENRRKRGYNFVLFNRRRRFRNGQTSFFR